MRALYNYLFVNVEARVLRNFLLFGILRVQCSNRRKKSNSWSQSLHNFLSLLGRLTLRLTNSDIRLVEVAIQRGEKVDWRKTNRFSVQGTFTNAGQNTEKKKMKDYMRFWRHSRFISRICSGKMVRVLSLLPRKCAGKIQKFSSCKSFRVRVCIRLHKHAHL